MMFWYDHDMSGWGYAGMVIGMILFWILIIVGIIALIRFSSGAFRTGTSPSLETVDHSPEQVLASRFSPVERSTKPSTTSGLLSCGAQPTDEPRRLRHYRTLYRIFMQPLGQP